MPAPRNPLMDEVHAAVDAELARVGPDAFHQGRLVERFLGRGAGRSSIARWVKAYMESGAPGQVLAKQAREAAEARRDAPPGTAAALVARALPTVPSIEDMAGSGGPIAVMDRLSACIGHAEKLLAHASPNGELRNTTLFLSASEHIRRTVETAAKLQESLLQAAKLERFHEAIFEALKEETPEAAERVLIRLQQINQHYGFS